MAVPKFFEFFSAVLQVKIVYIIFVRGHSKALLWEGFVMLLHLIFDYS